jgi:apolipoprotein N-acyltransferase
LAYLRFTKSSPALTLFSLLLLGAALAGAAELPYGGWIQIPILALVWWSLDHSNAIPFKTAFLLGWVFGLGYFIVGLWWLYISLHDIGGMNSILSCVAVFLLSAYVALYFAAASLSIRIFKNHSFSGLLLASSWVIFEYLRGEIFTGFPWMGFAEAQVNGPFSAIAPYLGGLGCTFFAVLTAWLLFCITKKSIKNVIGLLFALLIPVLASQWSFTRPTGEPLTVNLMQGNFAQSLIFRPEGILQQINFYSRAIANSDAELTIAPETAFPWPENNLPPSLFLGLQKLADSKNSNFLFGTIGRDPESKNGREFSNRAIGMSPKAQRYEYDKNHLVPFGEFIPPGFHWFVDAFSVPLSDFARGGNNQANFAIIRKNQPVLHAAITICYEDVFGGELASRIRNSQEPTNLLINITNLAWFGESQAPAQQLRLSQLRSLETGLPALRATNTGITAVLGHDGKVLASLRQFTQENLSTQVQAYTGKTPYVILGNFPILSISCLLLIWGFIRQRRF